MGLRDMLRRLEREAGDLGGTLRLPDGTEVRYEPLETFDALLATIDGREHKLLPYLQQIPTREGMPGIVRALEGSGERVS